MGFDLEPIAPLGRTRKKTADGNFDHLEDLLERKKVFIRIYYLMYLWKCNGIDSFLKLDVKKVNA